MSKATVPSVPRKGQPVTQLHPADKLKLEHHPVFLELSRAVRELLAPHPDRRRAYRAPDVETLGWVRGMALDELAEALATARAEFVKAAELDGAVL